MVDKHESFSSLLELIFIADPDRPFGTFLFRVHGNGFCNQIGRKPLGIRFGW